MHGLSLDNSWNDLDMQGGLIIKAGEIMAYLKKKENNHSFSGWLAWTLSYQDSKGFLSSLTIYPPLCHLRVCNKVLYLVYVLVNPTTAALLDFFIARPQG